MADVHWVKLSTDFYTNRKIRYLRELPKGDSLALIWMMLLAIAGRCNAGGTVFFTETVPFTPKMLARELNVKESVLLTALDAFEFAEMISRTEDGFISILGWEEHQNTEKLERIREQNRLRKQKQREKQKKPPVSHDGHTMSRDGHAADIDTDTDIETERKEEREENALCENANAKKPKQFIPPTVEEVREYCLQRKSGVDPVRFWEYFDTGGWKDSEGKPVRNWKQKLITWETHSKEKGKEKYDSTADSSNALSEWDHCYTFDGRTL